MAFTSKDVMELRQRTGVGMMDCKKALVETDGDMEKAIDFLREKGMASAAKKQGRIASEGIVLAQKKDNKICLVEVNCESDFVARGDQFKAYVTAVADYILANDGCTVEQVIEAMTPQTNEAVMKIGEKLSIRRFTVYEASADTVIDSYIHMGGKIGVVIEASANTPHEVLHDCALQVAAMNPSYVCSSEVPSAELEKEKEILKAQALNEEHPKPLPIIEKMVNGRINKYYKEVCLLEQVFFKDNNLVVKEYVKQNGNGTINKFVRYEMGEGLEKKVNDLAAEVAEQMQK